MKFNMKYVTFKYFHFFNEVHVKLIFPNMQQAKSNISRGWFFGCFCELMSHLSFNPQVISSIVLVIHCQSHVHSVDAPKDSPRGIA